MSWIAVAIGGSALLGYMGSQNQAGAAENAANLQYQGTQEASRQQREMFDILNEQNKPYREAGYGALTRINELLPSLTKPVTAADIQNMPGYQFAVQQGTGGAMQGMNVGGGGSNVQRAGQKFAIDYTMGQALPQFMQQRRDIYNTLAGVAGIGQNAQGQSNQIGQNTSTNLGQLAVGGMNALASGQVGAANANAAGMNAIGNAGMMYALLA
jgi:hypothetical protein